RGTVALLAPIHTLRTDTSSYPYFSGYADLVPPCTVDSAARARCGLITRLSNGGLRTPERGHTNQLAPTMPATGLPMTGTLRVEEYLAQIASSMHYSTDRRGRYCRNHIAGYSTSSNHSKTVLLYRSCQNTPASSSHPCRIPNLLQPSRSRKPASRRRQDTSADSTPRHILPE
ncbi:MAG: hypothetical protein ACREBW_08635, partial [Candidatus Micrarchaeaceae archaeon]